MPRFDVQQVDGKWVMVVREKKGVLDRQPRFIVTKHRNYEVLDNLTAAMKVYDEPFQIYQLLYYQHNDEVLPISTKIHG
jgi:hypothetical protein